MVKHLVHRLSIVLPSTRQHLAFTSLLFGMYRPFDGVEERFLSQVGAPCLASHPHVSHLMHSATFRAECLLFKMMMHHTSEHAPE